MMKHDANRRGVSKKMFIAMLALVLALGCAVGGTIAWLTDKTGPVTNTFTYGDINIELKETTGETYKIVPGQEIAKDPKVTVKAISEACWLFVKVDEENWPTFNNVRKANYNIADGWTALPSVSGVYYREVAAVTADTTFNVLKDNKVTVSADLTKTEIANAKAPTLTFTAYAVQRDGVDTVADAWAKVNP